MSMNPIDLLNEKVTPLVVSHSQLAIDQDKKESLLAQFYPILLSIFHRYPKLVDETAHLQENALQHVFAHHGSAQSELIAGFAKHHSLPQDSIKSLLNQAIPLSAQKLQEHVGKEDITAYLHKHLSLIANDFPAWAAGLIATLGLSQDLNSQSASQHVYTGQPEKKAGGFWRWLSALIAFLILAFLFLFFWKSCQNKDVVPVAASESQTSTAAQSQSQVPASLALTSGTGDQIQACHTAVGDQALAAKVQTALVKVFGSQAKCNVNIDQAYAVSFPAQDKLQEILALVKAVPNASLEWEGDKITLNAPDNAALKTLVEKVKALVPNLTVVSAQPLDVNTSVDKSIDQSKAALAGLDEHARPEDIARALNIQIINFGSGSKTIPQVNKDVLDDAAALIKKVPNVQLDVEGYTDSTGSAELNKNLSQRRAQSVVDYLVSKGVEKEKLKAVGYGQENPIADNVTDQGKFRNRRIEFKVINTNTGKTSLVDEQHAQTSTAE